MEWKFIRNTSNGEVFRSLEHPLAFGYHQHLEPNGTLKSGYEYLTQEEIDAIIIPELKQLSFEKKLRDLDNYHYTSPELRTLTVNGVLQFSMTKEGRDLINEQIRNLEDKVKLGLGTEETVSYNYPADSGDIPATLLQVRTLSNKIFDIVNNNYKVYRDHKVAINAINNASSTASDIDAYDFTLNYTKNATHNL